MKKIIWLSSYPKCGNTYVRLFLSHYLYNTGKKNIFDPIKKIPKFEKKEMFDIYFKDEINDSFLYYQNSTELQKRIIEKNLNQNLIFKTHLFFGELNGYKLFSKETTGGFVHLVRDPREVVISYSNHLNKTIDETVNILLDEKNLSYKNLEIIVNWKLHYLSWKSFNSVPSLLIKYEDLIDNPIDNFSKILLFLNTFIDFKFEKEKIKETIKKTKFQNLQNNEKKHGFEEAINGKFFRSGKKDSWKNILNIPQRKKIENKLQVEMQELGYL